MREHGIDPPTNPAAQRPEPPSAVLDLLLRLTPVNALLFNTELICDYAAPIDDALLGRPRTQLLGRSAADLLPPARNGLTPHLRRAADEGRGWSAAEFRFVDPSEADRRYCWSVLVEPVRISNYRGVLVTWQDIRRNADEMASLRAELAALRSAAEEREAALLRLYTDLRTAITPVWGYLQLIVRRPAALRERSPAHLIGTQVLPALGRLLAALERLREPPISRPDRHTAVTGRP